VAYLVFRKVQSSQNGKAFQVANLVEVVGADVELFDPEVVEVFDFGNLVAVETEDSKALISKQTINFLDVVVVHVKVL